jgi:hypothetical protein
VEARPLRYEEGRARAAMPRPKNFQALLRGSDSRPQSSRSRCRLRQGSQRCFQRSVRRETDFPRVRYPRHRRLSGCPRHRCGGCRERIARSLGLLRFEASALPFTLTDITDEQGRQTSVSLVPRKGSRMVACWCFRHYVDLCSRK